jgi:hypothetical protein
MAKMQDGPIVATGSLFSAKEHILKLTKYILKSEKHMQKIVDNNFIGRRG